MRPSVTRAARLERRPRPSGFEYTALKGRFLEVSGGADAANLSWVCRLLVQAQGAGERAAWIQARKSFFFPPDFAAAGVDLAELPLIRAGRGAEAAQAAEWLLRSGAFGLLIIDGGRLRPAEGLLGRLVRLADKNDALLLVLTTTPSGEQSLGSVVPFRISQRRLSCDEGRVRCRLEVLKDKGNGLAKPEVWEYEAPAGLC